MMLDLEIVVTFLYSTEGPPTASHLPPPVGVVGAKPGISVAVHL